MRKCRKMISVIMLMVMLVSLLPSGALAAEAPTGATNEVAAVEEPTEVEPATGETEETLPVESKTDGTENEDNNETSNTEGTSEGAPVSDDNEKDPAEDGTIGTAKSEEPTEGNAENAGLGETSTEIAAAVEPVDETVNKEAKAATSYEYEIKLGDSVSVKDLAVKAGLVTEEEAAEFAAGIAAVEFSNECVTVTHDSDWMLECVKVFQTPENLTITMADGTVHTVSVTCGTDAQVEFLDADWAYISEFGLNTEEGIIDGTETWDDLDDGPSNKKVRTYDVVTYNMHYSTAMYENTGLQNVSDGYMCYKFVLPADKMQAEWDTGSMGWLGTEYKNAAELESYTAEGGAARANKSGGYYKYTDSEGNQVIEGKRYMTPTEINPYAFPGSGTLAASVQVLIPDYGFEIIPEFYLWLDHNTKDGDCAEHERDEVKSFIADPVSVVSELRLNALIKAVNPMYSSYIGNYEFDNADSSEINYGEGTVYGATAIYGVTLQLYNKGIDKGLRGCALPTGDITIDVKLNASYKPDDGAEINLTEMGYKPLVYCYDTNDDSADSRTPGRPLDPGLGDYALDCGVPIDSINRTPTPFKALSGGTYRLWQGGDWAALQNGATVSFTNYDYTINPNWFPNSGKFDPNATTYYDPALGVRACDVGCFSALEMYVVYPTKFVNNEGETIDLVQDFGPGTIRYQTSDVNLMADSSAGSLKEVEDNSNQKKTDDDATAGSLYLSRPGSYRTIIRYNMDYTHFVYDTLGHYPGYVHKGQDSAGLGQEIGLGWALRSSTLGQPSAMISAAQSLIKLDADAIQLGEGTYYVKSDDENVAVTFLYGAKPDGSNWTSDDEQNSAREADLVWYTSYQEIEEQGKKCVAILAEWRIQDSFTYYSYWDMVTAQQAFVRNNLELTEKVYPIIIVVDFWTRKDMADLGLDINDFPSRMDVQAGTAEMPELLSTPWSQSGVTRTSPHELASKFIKAEYTNGAFTNDQNGEDLWGDSLYIVPYKASIKKILGQKNENGTDHQVFDLDNRQRVADYGLSVELKTDQPAAQLGTTTVTVTDVLPKGLSYIPESAYYGGTYEQTRLGMQGTVTGGISHEPDNIEPNEDGTTTLTWIIEDAQIGTTLPTIFYSCEIGHAGAPDDVQNNQSLTNTATVMSTEDIRTPEKANYKLDDASIRVSKLIATSVSKVADSKFVEATDDIGWTMYVGNNATNDIRNAVMLDTLPAFEDKAGTRIASDNKMKITEWTIDTTKASNVDTWIAFYTKDSKASQFISSDFTYDSAQGTLVGNPYSENYDESNTITWTPVVINVSGGSASIPDIYGIENITGVAVVGTLKGRETYQAHVKVKYSDPLEDGNRMVNTISRGDDTSKSTVYTAVRSLEGIVWKDSNTDGYRGHTGSDSEDVVSGVQVTLMKLKDGGDAEKPEDYEPYVIDLGDEGTKTAVVQTGSVMDLKTGTVKEYDLGGDEYDSGRYRFDGLPEGTFAVKFEEGNYMKFATSVATKVDAGDDRYDSDAKPTYTDDKALSSAFIANIVMPPLSKIANSRYVSRYHDLGVYQTGDLEVTKTVESAIAADKSVEFNFTITLGDTGINGTFGQMEFENGVATFKLKDGETKKATGLPVGVTYSVEEEANALFKTTSTNESGTIVYTTGKTDGSKKAPALKSSDNPPEMGDDPAVISVEFVNTRKTGSLEVTKTVVNRNTVNTATDFNFTVTLSDLTISGKFGDMTFTNGIATFALKHGEKAVATGLPTEVGYTVTETEVTGFTPDKTEETGTISGTASKAAFTNTYTAAGKYSPEVRKALNGRPLEKDQFTFTLTDKDGNELQAKNDAAGRVYFDDIEYDQDDMNKDENGNLIDTDVVYTAKEVLVTKDGYTYSKENYTITVTLHDNMDGTITATADKKPEDCVFHNTYEATGKIELPALKKLIGERALEEGQFTFKLKNEAGDVLSTKTNGADGSVLFDAIEYTQDDIYDVDEKGVYSGADTKTYNYTISEEIPEGAVDNGDGTFFLNGYTYDGTVYNVAVVLTDNGDGTITAVVAGTEDGAEAGDTETGDTEYVFANAYDANGTLKLDARKVFDHGVIKGGEFTFELKDAEGEVLQTKTNDAKGNVSFEMLTYDMKDLAGAPYVYTVSEVTGKDANVEYDKTVYTVTVDLADNGDGTLKVTKKIDNGGELVFTNKQLNVQTSIKLGGIKVLKGKDLKKGQFTFVLSDESGKNVMKAKNDANGNFTFDEITYKLEDLKGEKKKVYIYGISEINDKQSGIVYDDKAYTVKVTVTDIGDGTMTAVADTAIEEVKFTNSVSTKSNKTGDEAPLGVLFGGLGVGAAGLALIYEERRRKNRQK